MGKGAGCMPSKSRPPAGATESSSTGVKIVAPATTEQRSMDLNAVSNKLKIFIVFYSMYGHVESLARRMKKGVNEIDGVEGLLYRVPETLSEEVLVKMNAPVKDENIPVITAGELAEADGILFGFPTRFGSMAAQMKAFFDSTGQLWKEQKLAGKPAGFFVSTGTQGGGQETTAFSGGGENYCLLSQRLAAGTVIGPNQTPQK